MSFSHFSRQSKIPKITTRKSQPVTTNFSKGIYTYKPNDTMTMEEIRLAQDARFDRVGEYGTRPGYKMLMKPQNATEVASHGTFSNTTKPITKLQPVTVTPGAVDIMYVSSIVFKSAYTDFFEIGKHLVGRVTIRNNPVVGTPQVATACFKVPIHVLAQEVEVFFNEPIQVGVERGNVTVEFSAQAGDPTKIGINTGSNDSFEPCFVLKAVSGAGKIRSIFEANIDGDNPILYADSSSLYWRSSDGQTVQYITQLDSGYSEKVRFCQVQNQVRYVDGGLYLHVLTPTINNNKVTGWTHEQITPRDLKTNTALNVRLTNIMPGPNDNIMYFVKNPNTEAIWTYPYGYTYAKSPEYTTTATISGAVGTTLTIQIGTITPSGISTGDWITGQGTGTAEVTSISGNNVNLRIVDTTPQTISSYDKFCTDFYQNFPAINTGDPLTAMFNLGGVIYMMTRRNKYQMYTQTADAWTQNASNAQNGTFSQESVVCDLNYAYFANDNGVYMFDGASEVSLTENSIQNVYDNIQHKENITVDLFKNRLYVFYGDDQYGNKNHCLVYNINLKVWESFDSGIYVSCSNGRQNSSGRFLCGHSRLPVLMLAEDTIDNDYSDLGSPIAFNLETSYLHFGAPSQLKRITKWRPQFATTKKAWTCECGYSLDYTDQVKYAFSIDLERQEIVNTNYVWDNPSDYGVPAIPTINSTIPVVNGEFYRIQVRYQHIAAFEPVILRSHTLTVQTQRIR